MKRAIDPFRFSMGLVVHSVRYSAPVMPRPCAVRVSSRPSRRRAAAPGCARCRAEAEAARIARQAAEARADAERRAREAAEGQVATERRSLEEARSAMRAPLFELAPAWAGTAAPGLPTHTRGSLPEQPSAPGLLPAGRGLAGVRPADPPDEALAAAMRIDFSAFADLPGAQPTAPQPATPSAA